MKNNKGKLLGIMAGVLVFLSVTVFAALQSQNPTALPTSSESPNAVASASSSTSPSASESPSSPAPSPSRSATKRPTPNSSTKTFVSENRILVSSMHSILDEMVERALNEQMDILMSKNDELRTKFEKLESATPPASISTRWRDQLSRTSNEISDLRFASIEYTNARIGVDEFLSNFAPLRIELVALDALLDEAVAK